MKTKLTALNITVVLQFLSFASSAFAVEGGLGRPISGATINPYAGLVPPLPGFAVGVTEVYYDASIGGGTTVPIGVNLTLGVDMKASFTPDHDPLHLAYAGQGVEFCHRGGTLIEHQARHD